MKLINTVRQHRKLANITQADFARRVGVSRQTIVSIEGGDYVPSALLAALIARELGVTFEELFFLEGDDDR